MNRTWPKYLGDAVRPSTVGVMIAIVGVTVLMATAFWWYQARLEFIEHQFKRTQVQAQLEQERQRAAEREAVSQRTSPVHDPRWQAVQKEDRSITLSGLGVLERATKHPVYVMSVRVNDKSKPWRVEAETDSLADALHYIEQLRSSPGALVRLQRYEVAQDSRGQQVLRFSFEASLENAQ